MINEFPEEYNNLEIVVSIKHVVEGALASKLSGHFLIYNNKFSFSAVAFGRIGGHNISVKISRTTGDKIRKINLDPDIVIMIVQRKIIEGDIIIQTKKL